MMRGSGCGSSMTARDASSKDPGALDRPGNRG